jgi:predicted 3-demethylubiquinone-9 3-methyltransferase (glyoxalase superfamily)
MASVSPCLWFDDQAEEAAHFYTSVFRNSRIVEVRLNGEGGPWPAGSVLLVEFQLEGRPFIALNGGPAFTFNESISFYTDCDGQEEVDRLWSALTDGGEESQCGWLKDRFGVSWQIVPGRLVELMADPDPEKAGRVVQAMLAMKKIDIKELEDAYAGA